MRIPIPSLRLALPILIIIVLAAGLVISQVQLSNQRSISGARTSATAAAKTYAVDVASYNYQHLARDFGTVEDHATPSFRKTFKASSSALSKVLKQYHAIATAHIVAVGVESVTSSRAVVLLFVDQTVNNTAQKSGPTKDNSRIKMTLLRSGSQWRIDQVELL
jgi:Mce-associated membrane protein